MAAYKLLADSERCIKCGGCEVACKQQNDVPYGMRRIRVVTINEGKPNEANVPMACMHCSEPACMEACPKDTIYKREDGIVLVNKDRCVGCGYCLAACPFGAPQFESKSNEIFEFKGKMDKCTFCVEPTQQKADDGSLIQEEPKARCAAFCACKGLLAGDAGEISATLRERAATRIAET
jgi:formate dehydrogenase iron-sulfur subunit